MTKHPARDWQIEPLAADHDRASFRCGNDVLDAYLQRQAGQEARRHVAAPFMATEAGSRSVVAGYYTLSSFAIDLGDLPTEVSSRLPHYPVVPATLLGRLAVDCDYQGSGLGELLIIDALHQALQQSKTIASALVVVDAIDETAWRFYRHFEFIAFPQSQSRLFMPMKTIARLLG